MAKNIKLNKIKKTTVPEKEPFYFFVKDQGEGAARIAVIILKILELIDTSIFGIVMGIFAPLCIMFGDFDPDVASCPAMPWWLASAIVFIVGTVVVMLGHSKVASIIHTIGAVGILVTYNEYSKFFADIPDNNGPSVLYMPLLFLTIMTITIMLLINVPKWLDKHAQRVNAVAPSILTDEED